MNHRISKEDRDFKSALETGQYSGVFDHRSHLRLAYVYLTEHPVKEATDLMRGVLISFLRTRGVDPLKYHETLTRAWMMAVRHFMEKSSPSDSFAVFLDQNPRMLEAKIMMTHYSDALLSSEEARVKFVRPDLDFIPTYETGDSDACGGASQ